MEFLLDIIKKISVAKLIALSFIFAILGGSFILYWIEGGNLSYVNSLYIAASAICVTGLSPVNISEFTFLGQVFLMLMIQLGGLGVLTFTVLVGRLVISGLSRNSEIGEVMLQAIDHDVKKKDEIHTVYEILKSILKISLFLEAIGAIILYSTLPENIPGNVNRYFLSLFTSVSAFNNAGFSLLDDMAFIIKDLGSIYTIVVLVVFGGIGFPVIIFFEKIFLEILKEVSGKFEVWGETHLMLKAIKGQDPSAVYLFFTKLSSLTENKIESYNNNLRGASNKTQTNILIAGSLVLIFAGALGVYYTECNNPKTLKNLEFSEKIANSIFASVCARTAGFNTFNFAYITDSTLVLICSLMFIGGGPQGTAGGIKITTFVILMLYLKNVISSKKVVEVFGQPISKRAVAMSIRTYFLATTAIAILVFILAIMHNENHRIHLIFFEVISAFGTVGYSMGLTPLLGDAEKIVYCIIMFVGRIGIFTSLIALTGMPGTLGFGEEDDGIKIQVG